MTGATLESKSSKGLREHLKFIQASKVFWLVAVVALVLILITLPRSPLPWLDEIFYASGALSVARGAPSVPTVMGAFPHTLPLDLLYGPLMFWLGSLQMRMFGLSATSWRFLGFVGAVGCVFAAFLVSRRLDRSRTAAAAAAMIVALSQGMGARATSGRFDTFTVALEIFALAATLHVMQVQSKINVVYAVLAGVSCSLAALSTPRAFPFVLGLFGAIVVELILTRNRAVFTRGLVIGIAALLPVSAWTFSRGMSPIGWLRFIAGASRGDTVNASPILHGSSWQLFSGPRVPLLSGVLFILIMLVVFGGAASMPRRAMENEGDDVISALRLASITVLVDYLVLFLMIARFWDYEIFVVPLVTPVLIAWTAKILRNSNSRSLQRLVLGSWMVFALFLGTVRSGKVAVWLASYEERDPKPLQDFIANNLPRNSRVFGPEDFYFYAVESNGSHYLFRRKYIPPGLVSKLDHDLNWQEQLAAGRDVYLIWPKGSSLPNGLRPANLRLVGSLTSKRGNKPSDVHRAGWASGYPSTDLYQITSGDPGPSR